MKTMGTETLMEPRLGRSTRKPDSPVERSWKALAILGFLAGCGSRIDPGTDGSTHWLSCNTDAECGGLRCLERRCERGTTVNSEPSTEPGGETATPSQEPGESESQRALGELCLPAAEYQPEFYGFDQEEVTVEVSSQCSTGTCLVNHFRGRVTCLYGGAPADAGFGDCETPGGQPVTVQVQPQVQDRSPENAVYCSCRCDGPEPSADYCECGEGFECSPLAPIEVAGAEGVTGSYCVKSGTSYDRNGLHRSCDVDTASCGDAERYNAQTLGIQLTEGQQSSAKAFEYFAGLGGDLSDETACLPRPLPLAEGGDGVGAGCRIFELRLGGPGCTVPARLPVEELTVRLAREHLASIDSCSLETDCAAYSVCEIPQIFDADSTCRTQEEIGEDGWCYVSESQTLGNAQLLEACPEGRPSSKLRFGGSGVLAPGAFSYIVCSGEL